MKNTTLLQRFAPLLLSVPLLAFPLMASAATPSFSLIDMQGKTHTLAAHQGKWVLVNLWATWCIPCLTEMPELEALYKSRHDLVVLGVAVDAQNRHRVAQFAGKMGVTYPIIMGNEALAKEFKARGYPTSILYDPSGKLVLFKEGAVTREGIESALP